MGLTALQRVIIKLELLGQVKTIEGLKLTAAAAKDVAVSNEMMTAAAAKARKGTFANNQLLFTGRRLLFYSTLGTIALAGAVTKLGFSYANTMQQAQVALKPMFATTAALNVQMNKLFAVAALTPFQFKDIVLGFTQLLKAGDLGAAKVTSTIQAISDILSATPGRATASNLNRVSTALSHMVNVGTLIGQTRLQLERLGIPLDMILKKAGVSAEQLQNLGKAGIPAEKVLNAIILASKTMPRFIDQAKLSQLNTLSGAFSSFKDFLSQAAGGAVAGAGQGGIFGGIFKLFKGVDEQLAASGQKGHASTFTDIAKAFDSRLSPSTHAVINSFILFNTIFKTVLGVMIIFLRVVQGLINPFARLFNVINRGNWIMKALGVIMGISISIWITAKGALLALRIAQELLTLSTVGYTIALRILIGKEGAGGLIRFLKDWKIHLAALTGAFNVGTAAVGRWYMVLTTGAARGAGGQFTKLTRFEKMLLKIRTAMIALTGAVVADSVAWYANPITWIVASVALIVILTVLYFKWKKFHDIVNNTFFWFKRHPLAALFIPIVGQIVFAAVAISKFYDWLKKLYHLVTHPLEIKIKIHFPGTGGGGVFGILKKAAAFGAFGPAGAAFAIGNAVAQTAGLPHAASGGTVTRAGSVVVGEEGREIVSLPAGATIAPTGTTPGGWSMPSEINLKTILRVDGKDLAEVVAKHRLDRQARR